MMVAPVISAPFLNQIGLLQRLPVWHARFGNRRSATVQPVQADVESNATEQSSSTIAASVPESQTAKQHSVPRGPTRTGNSVQPQKKASGITALDFSKALLDHNIHAPTNYFPLLVPECLLIEPTETESKETLDEFVAVMTQLLAESRDAPERMKGAPYTMPVRRLDDVKAVKELDVSYRPAA